LEEAMNITIDMMNFYNFVGQLTIGVGIIWLVLALLRLFIVKILNDERVLYNLRELRRQVDELRRKP
jgi:hypothetical protein